MNMMSAWLCLIIFFVIAVCIMVIVGIGLLAGYMASAFGFHGVLWWCVTLVVYLIIGGIILMIYRIGGD